MVVIGDFIFETKLPRHIEDRMEEICRTVTSMGEFDPKVMTALVEEPARTTLTISRDKKRAEKIRSRIKEI